jgi:hypothetical protein
MMFNPFKRSSSGERGDFDNYVKGRPMGIRRLGRFLLNASEHSREPGVGAAVITGEGIESDSRNPDWQEWLETSRQHVNQLEAEGRSK